MDPPVGVFAPVRTDSVATSGSCVPPVKPIRATGLLGMFAPTGSHVGIAYQDVPLARPGMRGRCAWCKHKESSHPANGHTAGQASKPMQSWDFQ